VAVAYDDIEQSVQDAGPAELYEFITNSSTTRLTSYGSDVTFGGNVYSSVPLARGSLEVTDLATDQQEMVVEIPEGNAVAVAYSPGIPIESLRVRVTRYHPAWGVSLQIWDGYASDMKYRGHMAAFRVPSGTGDALALEVPSARLQRLCNHILYDAQCTIDPNTKKVSTTISAISLDALTITVGTLGAVGALKDGYIKHIASGEKRTITQTPSGTDILIQCQFPNGLLAIGNAVELYAGCDHQVATCKNSFNNVVNFGGHPYVPSSNLFYVGLLNTRYHY
jgi:uncharacterized phage protein (TIGR02218 family)